MLRSSSTAVRQVEQPRLAAHLRPGSATHCELLCRRRLGVEQGAPSPVNHAPHRAPILVWSAARNGRLDFDRGQDRDAGAWWAMAATCWPGSPRGPIAAEVAAARARLQGFLRNDPGQQKSPRALILKGFWDLAGPSGTSRDCLLVAWGGIERSLQGHEKLALFELSPWVTTSVTAADFAWESRLEPPTKLLNS